MDTMPLKTSTPAFTNGDFTDTSARLPLGKLLIERGLLRPVQLEYALQKQKIERQRLGVILVRHGLATEYDIASVLAEQRGISYVNVDDLSAPESAILNLFNREFCLARGFLPLKRVDDGLLVVLGEGDSESVAEAVMRRTGLRPVFVQGAFSKVIQQIRHAFFFAQNPIEQLVEREIKLLEGDVDTAQSPSRLLELLLHLAVRERATDVHIAPSGTSLHLLFRVDGVMRPVMALPNAMQRLLVLIKLMAEMDISEQRRPQDGSFMSTILESPFTIRVSTLVSEFGERMVLRLLPDRGDLNGLGELGFFPEDVELLRRVFDKPAGLVLMTGPTGSGKSTTLHAALRLQSLIERNVLTVEDPVEYRVSGACQTEVNRRAGYEFGNALRHFLRHDPDVMLIGEIRDGETAQSAIESAATGHLVLSTLHVSNVFGVVPRLRPMGLDPQAIADNLIAVVNQRLVRRNCQHCARPAPLTEEVREWLGEGEVELLRGDGCEHCGGSGYHGRIPVYEILCVDQALADAIADDAGRERIRAIALASGFRPMSEMAKRLVAKGLTTVDEIVRVVGIGPRGHAG